MKSSVLATISFTLLTAAFAYAQSQSGWSAQFADSASLGQFILVDFGAPFVFDLASHLVTISDGSNTLDTTVINILSGSTGAVLRAEAEPIGQLSPDSFFKLKLSNFTDSAGSAVVLNDFTQGSRNYLIVFRGKKDGQLYTVNVTVQAKSAAKIVGSTLAWPKRDQIVLEVSQPDAASFFQALSKRLNLVQIEYDFGTDSTVSNIKTGVARIDPAPAGGNAVTLYPKTALPYHSTPYKVNITLPKAALPSNLEIPPGGTTFKVTASANYPSPPVVETSATYDFQPTFTSAVNKSKGTRTNTGLFLVTINPVLLLHENGTDGAQLRYTHWYDFRPNISANVDTLPEKSSTTPNRITIALDAELGGTRLRGSPAGKGGAPFDQGTWTNGVRTDTDRDFKVFSTYWHTDLAFDPWKWSETQAFRTQNLVALGKTSTRPKSPFVTAYRLRPSFGYDIGATTVRSGTFNPELGTDVSRFLLKVDTMLELQRNVAFTVTNTGYYLFNATRRTARDFFDAQVAVNTGLLLRLDTNKIQSAVTLKYQRGSQPPRFTPVDTISLGLKLYR